MIKAPKGQIKKALKTTVAVFLSMTVCLTSMPPVLARADKISELEAKIQEAKAQKAVTQSKINENKEELSTLNSTQTTLKGTLKNLNNELSDVSDSLAKLEDQISAKNSEIEQMEVDLEEAREIEANQYYAMKMRIKFMYEKQNYAVMESLFGSESFSDFLNKNDYFEAIEAYDRKMLEQYRKTCAVIDEAKALLNEERTELEALKAETVSEQNRVSSLVAKTSKTISNYQSEIAATEEEMRQQEETLKQQQDSIASLQKQLEEERRLRELANKSAWRDISQVSFAEGDRELLANLIYCEAGNQPYQGQVAVGAVVVNRVLSAVFPSTMVGVIYQKNQFSPVGSGRLALALSRGDATPACYQAADAAMSGQTTVGNCLFFRTPIPGLTGIQIGGHIFY